MSTQVKTTIWFLFLLQVFTLKVCKAQLPMPQLKHFGIAEGYFSNSGINDIQTDSNGTIWIISFGDITKFNGKQFGTLNTNTVKHSNFIRFYKNPRHSPFVTDYQGRIFFIERDTLRPYAYNDTLVALNKAHACSDIYFDKNNNLHVSFRAAGYHIISPDGTIKTPFNELEDKSPEGFTAVLRSGQKPFISLEKQLEGTYSKYMVFTLVSENLKVLDTMRLEVTRMRFPQSVIQLPGGNYLLATGSGHLIEFNEHQILRKIPYNYAVVHIFKDDKNGIWIATSNKGLNYYKDGVLTEENKRVFFGKAYAAARTQDYNGGIWIHSQMEGLTQIPNPEHFYYQGKGSQVKIPCKIDLMNGSILTSGKDGALTKIDLDDHSDVSFPIPIDHTGFVRSVLYDSVYKRTWVARKGKVFYSDNNTWKSLNLSKLQHATSISRINIQPIPNSKYSFLGICHKQMFLVSDTTIKYVSPVSPTYPVEAVMHNDSIWYYGEGKLYLLTNDSIQDIGKEMPELQKGQIQYISSFNGKVCISINPSGTFTLSKEGLQPIMWGDTELPYGAPHTVDSKRMWLFSLYGNFLIEREKKERPRSWSVSAYQPFQQIGSTLPKSNQTTLFWGLPNFEILRVDFKDLKKTPLSPPLLRYSQLKIKRVPVPTNQDVYNINYRDRHIQISYEGLLYQQGGIQYRYWLKGFEDDWTLTLDKSIQYTTLPSGNYSFEVQARRLDGYWSPSKTLRFKVAPPYWETWWFLGGCFAVALLIAFTIGTIRIRVIRREQQLIIDRLKSDQNALQAQMDPHFVFNILASVQYLVLESSKERTVSFLNMFSRSLRNTLDQTRKNSLPLKYEIRFLREYIEMERFRLEDKFDFEIHEVSSELQEQPIPPFIIQPFVENAIQHGLKNKPGKGRLMLKFDTEGNYFKITVRDNGVGRLAAGRYKKENGSHKGQSHGVDIIRKRLSLFNSRKENILITDLKNDKGEALGTEVLIFIKRKDHESTHH